MKNALPRPRVHVGPNLTPMVDVVMCILIFFMLGSTFSRPEFYLSNTMPALNWDHTRTSGQRIIPPMRDLISIRMEGETPIVSAFGKQYRLAKDDRDPSAMIDEFPIKRAALSDDVQIVLAPEAGVSWQVVISVYDQLVSARFKHVAFAPV